MAFQNGRNTQVVKRLSIFELADKLFGLDILMSREVIPLPKYTPLPNSGKIYSGVFNLRGEIFPLVDVSPILGLPPKKIQQDDMVILLDDSNGFDIGIVVDKIHRVLPYISGDIKLPQGIVSNSMKNYIQGILDFKEEAIHILDLDSLFKTREILTHY